MANRLRLCLAAGGMLMALMGCTKHPSGAPAPVPDLITQEQMLEHHFLNAYDAVAALHSNWLQERGINSFSTPGVVLVYMDDNKLGGVDELRALTVESIKSIRYFDAIQATQRWGVGHTQGVILVSSNRR